MELGPSMLRHMRGGAKEASRSLILDISQQGMMHVGALHNGMLPDVLIIIRAPNQGLFEMRLMRMMLFAFCITGAIAL